MNILLNTPYKGERNYIQGGDFFNEISSVIKKKYKSKNPYISQLKFSGFAYKLCRMVIGEKIKKQPIVGSGVITFDDKEYNNFHLIETNHYPTKRVEFDEESIVLDSSTTTTSIGLTKIVPFSTIEIIIALTKHLNNETLPLQEEQGKWVFGRIDLTFSLPIINKNITIVRTSSVAGRFNINNILIDSKLVGKIQFIVGSP